MQRPGGTFKEGSRDWDKILVGENKVKMKPCERFRSCERFCFKNMGSLVSSQKGDISGWV